MFKILNIKVIRNLHSEFNNYKPLGSFWFYRPSWSVKSKWNLMSRGYNNFAEYLLGGTSDRYSFHFLRKSHFSFIIKILLEIHRRIVWKRVFVILYFWGTYFISIMHFKYYLLLNKCKKDVTSKEEEKRVYYKLSYSKIF